MNYRLRVIFAVVSVLMLWFLAVGTGVSAEQGNDEIRFVYRAGSSDLGIYICNYSEEAYYEVSLDGGRSFVHLTNSRGMRFPKLPKGTYQLCVRMNRDPMTVTNVVSVSIRGDRQVSFGIKIKCEGIRCDADGLGGIRVTIEEHSRDKRYLITFDGGKTWSAAKERVILKEGVSAGYYHVRVRTAEANEQWSETVKIFVPEAITSDRAYIMAPVIKQLPDLPTGCEVTSLAMALNYYGLEIRNTILADFFLEKAAYRTGDYREKFVGNPRDINAYGCFAGVIVKCAEKFLATVRSREFEVIDLTGCEPDTLYRYVDKGYPVIVWATQNLVEVKRGASWIDKETKRIITWTANEHCMLLVGYDKKGKVVMVNDPLKGSCTYSMELFEQRFADLEKQAIIIVEKEEN